MSLLKELQERWTTTHDTFTRWQAKVDELVNELRDLETAITALTPTPDFEAEKATAREQLERELDHVPTMRADWEDEPNDFEDFEDDTPAEHISILTGDPAIEPETGLHGEPVELVHDVSDLLTGPERMVQAAPDEAPALIPDMQYEREEPVALPQPEWNEPVTNPEADALAKAHDWYDPKAVADRSRFNPFAMFRREPEEV